jgi:hypothetical protein
MDKDAELDFGLTDPTDRERAQRRLLIRLSQDALADAVDTLNDDLDRKRPVHRRPN